MTYKSLVKQFKYFRQIVDLHEQNDYFSILAKIDSALFILERSNTKHINEADISDLPLPSQVPPLLREYIQGNNLAEKLTKDIPQEVIDMLVINGLGVGKVKKIWRDLNMTTLAQLEEACKNHSLQNSKGFGAKTEAKILEELQFLKSISGKLRIDQAIKISQELKTALESCKEVVKCEVSGQTRRYCQVIDTICLAVLAKDRKKLFSYLNSLELLRQDKTDSSLFIWRGKFNKTNVEIHFCKESNFYAQLFLTTTSEKHLADAFQNGIHLYPSLQANWISEKEIYEKAQVNYVAPELREGTFEFNQSTEKPKNELIEYKDIKGVIHVHSQYSDGEDTIEDLAKYCIDCGYEYLGLTDHSVSAFYANGLSEEKVKQQHEEIDRINEQYAPFRIFKGIEADILPNGDLDYSESVLESFDFVIASIHSQLNMTEQQATERLLKAIANPHTTLLGHLTGRLLLKRKGYEVDHEAIIQACQKYQVDIELNANPYRMDLDWRWIDYAQKRNVKICITPDAHAQAHCDFMKLGVFVARKGNLETQNTLNALSTKELENHLNRKSKTQ